MSFLDHHLPFSLLHKRGDQYRFTSQTSSSQQGIGGSSSVGEPSISSSSPVAFSASGFHPQAVLDSNCLPIVSDSAASGSSENDISRDISSSRDNSSSRDIPSYDMAYVLKLLSSAMRNDSLSFWAQILSDHSIKVDVNGVDSYRTAFFKHLFTGVCVSQAGSGCCRVVWNEQLPEKMGVKMIDTVLEWLDLRTLTLEEYSVICSALDITFDVNSSRKRRELVQAMCDHRRLLLQRCDESVHSLENLVTSIGSTSSAKTIKSVGTAHGLEWSRRDNKDKISSQILNHVSRGGCVENLERSDFAPACSRLVKEAQMRNHNSIALQVFILRHIIDTGSKKLIAKTLDIHEVAHESDDSLKKLKGRLKKFVLSIQRGKLKDIDDQYSAMERLRKLEEVRNKWPTTLPMPVKEQIVRDFRAATSFAELASFTCLCCARATPLTQRVRKLHNEINLDLLEGPPRHWNDSSFAAPPTPFAEGPLRNKILDADGVTFEGNGVVLDMCKTCSRGLHRRTLPKHALANRLYVGAVPEELADLTMVEESMIAQARSKSWIVKLQEHDTDVAAPTAQRGLKGHTIIYPQEPDKLASLLPPSIEETLTFICVVFVGKSKMTNTWLREKAKPLVVRREKVRSALVWLKRNNPLYKDIEISESNLDSLPLEDVLPYHVEHVDKDDAQEVLVSRYDNSTELPNEPTTESRFDSVVVADVDAHTPVNQLRAAAVRHVKTQGKLFVRVGHGAEPMNEFNNVDLFPKLYPTLFPYGCGGFEDRCRKKPISMKEHVKTIFSWHDNRFQTHYSFLFTVFNMLQRRALLLGCSLKVKKASFSRFAKQFSSVSSQAVARVLERVEKGERLTIETDEDRQVLRLMKEVNLVTSKVQGSSASRVAMRNEIRALTMTHGMPSFYVTINPADSHNPIVKFLAGENIDLDNILEEQIPKYWEQAILLSTNPTVGASFFNRYLKAFIKTVLKCDENGTGGHDGVLGTVKAHYGCVEAQGRGSLHCHMLVWVEGALNPNEIRERVMKDPEWGRTLLDYLDDTITNIVPEDPIPEKHAPFDGKDPCSLRGVNLDLENIEERLTLRMKDTHNLAERVQRHRHSHTCYKYYRAGEERKCRFDLKEENFRSESTVDHETGLISLRCLDGLVNNFNMTMLEALRCNMDIQFIGSGESAKAMIYYITDYITKSQLKSHVAYAALQVAVKKCETVEDEDDDFTVRSKHLLQKGAYALISHQEMSAQQVVSYLMDYEDHFTSHSYGNLYWAAFERYIEASDSEKLFLDPKDRRRDEEPTDNVLESDEKDDEDEIEEPPVEGIRDNSDEAETFPDVDEEVVIKVKSDGSVIALADQVADYTFRPLELKSMCLWDFVAKTTKFRSKKRDTHEMSDGPMSGADVPEEDASSDDEDDVREGGSTSLGGHKVVGPEKDESSEDEEDVTGERNTNVGVAHDFYRKGMKSLGRFEFLEGHGDRGRLCVGLRARDVVPVLIGPAMPRRDDGQKHTRYCRLMLILFKPWRSFSDLREQAQSWGIAFETYTQQMNLRHKEIINNMQVLHECRDSRDDHMQTRIRLRTRGGGSVRNGGGDAQNDIEEIDMAEVCELLDDVDRMTSRKKDDAKCETEECIKKLTEAGFFSTVSERDDVLPEGDEYNESQVLDVTDDNLEDEWRDTYERRKTAWRAEVSKSDADAGECDPVVDVSSMDETHEDVEMVDPTDVVHGPEQASDGIAVGYEVAMKWTLNKEQKRAFDLVALHSLEENPGQLLLYLGGPGGTGKSRVVSALRDFFECRNQTRRFRLAAYTGVAARNIGGATLHSLLQMNESGRDISLKTKRDLAAMWEGVDYLFIDEVSMLGCEMLHNVSHALNEATGNTAAFGKMNVILAGDFAQLPPIGDTRLYKDINTSRLAASATNRAQAKVLGRLLWLSFEKVVILQESMRQPGRENNKFVELLNRLRDGVCDEEDYKVLAARILHNKPLVNEGNEWDFVPVVVTNNATRDEINRKATEAFALRTGRELHWYHAIDTHRKVTIRDAALIEKLEAQHSGQTKHRLRTIPLVLGMPVAINQNFDVAAGVVNGSQGILRNVRYFTGTQGQRYLRSCVVEIPNSEVVDIPHLPEHHFPVLPDVTDLKFEHGGSHKKCTIKRRQVPIEPGFAMTVHKAQGQTMPRVIVDLEGCIGAEQSYVMISRATSLNGLRVLRGFDSKQIRKRRSEDLRKEFKRLLNLKWKTIVEIGIGDEVKEAKRKLGMVDGKPKKRRQVASELPESKKRKKDDLSSEVSTHAGKRRQFQLGEKVERR